MSEAGGRERLLTCLFLALEPWKLQVEAPSLLALLIAAYRLPTLVLRTAAHPLSPGRIGQKTSHIYGTDN